MTVDMTSEAGRHGVLRKRPGVVSHEAREQLRGSHNRGVSALLRNAPGALHKGFVGLLCAALRTPQKGPRGSPTGPPGCGQGFWEPQDGLVSVSSLIIGVGAILGVRSSMVVSGLAGEALLCLAPPCCATPLVLPPPCCLRSPPTARCY